jgi:hypothetical protein
MSEFQPEVFRFILACYAAQAQRIEEEKAAAALVYRRSATDDELVDEGIKGMLEKRFDNSSKAAEAFYDHDRISGQSINRDSKITRIRQKIDKRLKEMSGG